MSDTLKKSTLMTAYDEALVEIEITDDNGAPGLLRVPVRVFGSAEVEYAGGPVKSKAKIEIFVRTIAGWQKPSRANLESDQLRSSSELRNLVSAVQTRLSNKIVRRHIKFSEKDFSWTLDPFLLD